MLQIMYQQMSKHFHNKKVRYKMDCYILHTVKLVIIFLFIMVIICCHYAKHRSQHFWKTHFRTKNIKMKNNKCKKVRIKNRTCYYFD